MPTVHRTLTRFTHLTLSAVATLALAAPAWGQAHAADGAQGGGRLLALIAQKQAQTQAAALPTGVQRIADVPYGSDPRQRMDVYLPTPSSSTASAVRAPVVFMVHGGGWRHGDKAMGRVVQEKVNR